MHKGYANIAYSIGKGIQSRTSLNDRLPDRLLALLGRLRERDDLKNNVPASQSNTPRQRQV